MTLFYRDGRAFTGKPLLTESGAPYTQRQEKCSRCGGAGGSDKWEHTGWRCYDCGGTGAGRIVDDKLYTAEKLVKLNAAKAKADAKKEAKRAAAAAQREVEAAARRDVFRAEYVELFALVEDVLPKDAAFVKDVVNTAVQRASISERQIEVLESAYIRARLEDERLARCKASGHVGVIGGRIRVIGKVRRVFTMQVQSFRGYGNETLYIVTIDGDDGSCYVYKGNAGWKFGEKGAAVDVTASVKEHNEYRDEKQTLIARPKFHNEEQEAA